MSRTGVGSDGTLARARGCRRNLKIAKISFEKFKNFHILRKITILRIQDPFIFQIIFQQQYENRFVVWVETPSLRKIGRRKNQGKSIENC